VADERAPKSSAQRELNATNQFTQQKQQNHANDDSDSSVTNKHRAILDYRHASFYSL